MCWQLRSFQTRPGHQSAFASSMMRVVSTACVALGIELVLFLCERRAHTRSPASYPSGGASSFSGTRARHATSHSGRSSSESSESEPRLPDASGEARDRGVVSGFIASSSRRRPSLKSFGSRPALGARGFFVRVKHTDIESARPVDRGFGPFVRGLPFPPGPDSGAGTNTGSGARRLRPVVLSSSAKRRARTSSDTAICSRAGVSIAFPSPPVVASSEMFARTVPAASPRARSGAAASADASRLAPGASVIERRA